MIKSILRKLFNSFLDIYFTKDPNKVKCIKYRNWKQLVWVNEDVSRRIALHIFENAESKFLKGTIKAGWTILDLGANVGYYTNLFSSLAGPQGFVLAIDANPRNSALIRLNSFLNNRQKNILSINSAIGEKDGGFIKFNGTEDSTYGYVLEEGKSRRHLFDKNDYDLNVYEVAVRTVDSILSEYGVSKVNFVKIDVEGFEYFVCKGMQELLSNKNASPDLMMIEIVDSHLAYYNVKRETLFAYLKKYNYSPFILQMNELISYESKIHTDFPLIFFKKNIS